MTPKQIRSISPSEAGEYLRRHMRQILGLALFALLVHDVFGPHGFIAMRRTARGYYEMQFEPLATAPQSLPSGALTERYARRVEQKIHCAPSDWPWSHKRWKLKKSLYQNRGRAEA